MSGLRWYVDAPPPAAPGRRSRGRAVLAAGAVLVAAAVPVVTGAGAAGAEHRTLTQYTQSGGSSSTIPGNATAACRQLLGEEAMGYKLDSRPKDGSQTFTAGGFAVTIVGADGGKSFTFLDAAPPVAAVIVKGASNADKDTNVYTYPSPVTADEEALTAAQSAQQISHITFCVGEDVPVIPQDLAVRKTADGSSTRTVTWELTKTANDTSHEGTAGTTAVGSTDYEVGVVKSESTGSFTVSGEIEIENPNAFGVDVSVVDTLKDLGALPLNPVDDELTNADVDCDGDGVASIGAATTITCTYSVSGLQGDEDENTAVVTVTSPANVNGGSDTVDIEWADPTLSGYDTVTVTDAYDTGASDVELGTTSDSASWPYTKSFDCPASGDAAYVNGTYVYKVPNVAKITETGAEAPQEVTVTCKQVWAGESATGKGAPWSAVKGAPKNWFMYGQLPADLVYGRNALVAGDIAKDGNTVVVTLDPGFRFAAGSGNVKVLPLAEVGGACPKPAKYVQPGQFTHHATAQSPSVATVTVPATTSTCYAVHANIERLTA